MGGTGCTGLDGHSPFWPRASSHLPEGESLHPFISCPCVCVSIRLSIHPFVCSCISPSVYPSIHPPSHPCSQYRLGVYYGPGTISSTGWEHGGGAFSWGPAMVSNIVATLWPWSCWALAVVARRGRLRALIHQSLLWRCAERGDSKTLSFQLSFVISVLLSLAVLGLPSFLLPPLSFFLSSPSQSVLFYWKK